MNLDPSPTIARVRLLLAVRAGLSLHGSGQHQCARSMVRARLLRELAGGRQYRITANGTSWLRDVERHWAGWEKAVTL